MNKTNISNRTYFSIFILVVIGAISVQSCLVTGEKYTKVAPGIWRAYLKLTPDVPVESTEDLKPFQMPDVEFEEVSEGELPFLFEVIYESEDKFYIEIINGEERIQLRDISFGRKKTRVKDSIRINFPVYESYIIALVEGDVMEGNWYVPSRGDYKIPFVANFGEDYRFSKLRKKPVLDMTGKWAANFSIDTDNPYPAVGEFEQKENHLSGTFRTETGDYRFLEGAIQANKIYLSCFDGAHAFLFEGKIKEDSTIIGSFRSGKHYQTLWDAEKNEEVELESPDSLTYLLDGYETLEFAFENPEGKVISLENEEYQDKVKIVQILGTWCPNCRDETEFLVNYLKENNHEDLKVIALAFEKYREKDRANKAINTYKKHFGMNYEMVYAGYYNKKEAVKSLPMLNHILSYPTLLFLDRNNKVQRIHTGFAGPATSQYEDFVEDFDEFVNKMMKDK